MPATDVQRTPAGTAGTFVFKVEGMDCGGCAGTLKKAVERMPGAAEVTVSLTKETMTLLLDESATDVAAIEKKVRQLGFYPALCSRPAPEPEPVHVHGPGRAHDHDHHGHDHAGAHDMLSAPQVAAGRLAWKIEGVDCASCAVTISRALEKLPGVADVHVSVTNETLTLILDEALTPPGVVESRVASLGYTPSRMEPALPTEETAAPQPPVRRRWWKSSKAKVAATAGGLLMAAYVAGLLYPPLSYWAFLLATVVAAASVSRRALVAAFSGAPFTIEMLLAIAAAGAIAIGAVEEAAVVVFLFTVGEVLEGFAASRARAGIKALNALVPRAALVEEGGVLRQVAAERLAIGQTVVVRTGDRVPADGEVLDGMSSVDESPITGESQPRLKEPGATVFAGSINREATLKVRVDKEPRDNTIARIIALVEEAQDAKAPTERFIDRFARIYMPLVVGIAILVAIVPPLAMGGEWTTWIYRALALLLIGCPCALVISVPAAIASSLSSAARHGLLVKGGAVVESLAKARMVVFDKTGTLTRGEPVVTDIFTVDDDRNGLLASVAALEQESSHPLAKAVLALAEAEKVAPALASRVAAVAGKGVAGTVGGRDLFVGAPRFARDIGRLGEDLETRIRALEDAGKSVVVAMAADRAIGIVALRDEPRSDAASGVEALKRMGIGAMMLSGDNRVTATAIARGLGIEAQAEMLPQDKVSAVRDLAGRAHTVMVGDGINDAPALAAAHVGIAMGSGTDVALEAADVALLRNRVGDVATLISLSRATMRNIRQNVAIALGLKGVFLVTTIAGVTGLWIAVFADTGATVLVTLNAMRLLGFLGRRKEAGQSARMDLQPAG